MAVAVDDDTSTARGLLQLVLDQERCDHNTFARRLAAHHQRLGLGTMACRPEKISRWKKGRTRPDRRATIAMADMLGVPLDQAHALGWPHWLRLALRDDRALLASPWTPSGTVQALELVGGFADMERREFVITGGTLAALLASWTAAAPATAVLTSNRRPLINDDTVRLIDDRLATLRHLDDQIGSGQTYALACAERRMITHTLKNTSCSTTTGRRLFAAAAEASRISGWCALDSGHPAQAQRHYLAALRSAGSAADPVVTANTLGFWAMLRYSTGDPEGALQLVDAAHRHAARTDSRRMTAVLHARASRAHARAGNTLASQRAEHAMFDTYERAGPPDHEPTCVYWINRDELHGWAATNALDLRDPRRALTHHAAITPAHQPAPRTAALRLARQADAHLALGDIEAAVHTADQAVQILGGVASSRGTSLLTGLKNKLAVHVGGHIPARFVAEERSGARARQPTRRGPNGSPRRDPA
ncbi:transcriptional regulator [Streptomyces sp. NPDC056937]|uniref:transcriptional regulator n=1 Tax=Streptomyces sp. NPDC056937 TaxID=3345969 RepID=UPI003632F8A0